MRYSKLMILAFVIPVAIAGAASCKKKPATKEEATKQIVSDIIDSCKAGKNEAAAKQYNDTLPDENKTGRSIDYSTSDGKQKAERLCAEMNRRYSGGYEFGKMETKGDMIAWNVFPKGGNEGQLFAFKQENGRWTIVDVDPAKR